MEKHTLSKRLGRVYKKPFSGVGNVIEYLGRYSHRVAITNHRLISIEKDQVTFSYKDYRDNAKTKSMSLNGKVFLHRFSLHFLPPRFRKIRNYGMYSNASKAKSLAQARSSLRIKVKQLLTRQERKTIAIIRIFGTHPHSCPICKKGKMKAALYFSPNKDPPQNSLLSLQSSVSPFSKN